MTVVPSPNGFRRPSNAEPPRMDALAVLPVFFALAGKRAVVSGGTAAAAWKAELLVAAGAHVDIYAHALEGEMKALLTRGAASGTLAYHQRPWSPECLKAAALAICDAATEGEAKAFYCAARDAGTPVNVIDRPAFCEFQFGSIVNRSPVVIGISTHGAAPILAQAIRRRIETLLPTALADWAALAARLRGNIMARLKAGPARRAFWERFSDRAFSEDAPEGDTESLIGELVAGENHKGRVTLVGAGPGNAEFLTLKAVRALQAADIILFDDLVSDDVLELARREAKRMMVGKRGGRQSCRQDDINALMLKLARQGHHVVRLKSGDPMIFGRAGEEIETLQGAGIDVAVVPGITAASGMAAALKRSLTHRDKAQSVSFITGHSRQGALPETIDIEQLTGPGKTAVIYMGGQTCRDLVSRLLNDGLSPHHPAIAMRSIGRPDEAVWQGQLAGLPKGVRGLEGDGPVLLGLGDVFETEVEEKAVMPCRLAQRN